MKKIYIGILTFLLCTSISGCGKIDDNSNKNTGSSISSSNKIAVQTPSDSSETDNNEYPAESGASSNDNTNIKSTSIPTNKPTSNIETGKLTASQPYSDINKTVTVLGLKEYKKIEGENDTDIPSKKGNKFLVLFLSVKNDTIDDYYMNYNYLSAEVDGKNIKHTFLLNDPRNYPTIFTHIEAGKTAGGFIVWEVPNNWKKFNVTYDGWTDIDNVSIKATFEPKDLFNPPIYDAIHYD